jgi:hypothetical protein
VGTGVGGPVLRGRRRGGGARARAQRPGAAGPMETPCLHGGLRQQQVGARRPGPGATPGRAAASCLVVQLRVGHAAAGRRSHEGAAGGAREGRAPCRAARCTQDALSAQRLEHSDVVDEKESCLEGAGAAVLKAGSSWWGRGSWRGVAVRTRARARAGGLATEWSTAPGARGAPCRPKQHCCSTARRCHCHNCVPAPPKEKVRVEVFQASSGAPMGPAANSGGAAAGRSSSTGISLRIYLN